MKDIFFAALLFLPVLVSAEKVKNEGYRLVWSDEFDKGGKLNNKEWKYETGFVRNKELQWYQEENAFVKDGRLIIEARKETKLNPDFKAGGNWRQSRKYINFTSACVLTRKTWKYGRFEVRAKIKCEDGLWPAIWTLGEKGKWPANGEIDILEYYQKKILSNTVRASGDKWKGKWITVEKPLSYFNDLQFDQKFHTWRMDWESNSIKVYLDGKLLNHTDLRTSLNPEGHGPENPFRQPHYLLLNLALGSNGGPPGKTIFPSRYEIDYVRVYQKEKQEPEETWKPVRGKPYKVLEKTRILPDAVKKGVRGFSEIGDFINARVGWEHNSDSHAYFWTIPGSAAESGFMSTDKGIKNEGVESNKFILHTGWSRFTVEMKEQFDQSIYSHLCFDLKSKDAASWDEFSVICEDAKGTFVQIPLKNLGFMTDGKWHSCKIQIPSLKKSGLDITRMKKLIQISWGGGVVKGHSFHMDNLHLIKK